MRMIGRRWLTQTAMALLSCLLVSASSTHAAEQVAADAIGRLPVSLTAHFSVFEDPTAALTLPDLRKTETASRFTEGRAPTDALSFGHTRSAYWLRLELKNNSDYAVQRLLEISHARISNVQFFQPDESGDYRKVETGNALPFDTRPYVNRFFVFPVTLPEHSATTVYLRVHTIGDLVVPAKLWEPTAYHAHERSDYNLQSLFFGLAAGMILFNLLLGITLKDSIYLLYVAFVSCMAATIAARNGLAKEFLWPDATQWSDQSHFLGFALAITVAVQFSRRMLNTAVNVPRLDPWLKGLLALNMSYLLVFVVSFETFARYTAMFLGVTTVLMLALGIYLAIKKTRSAYFYLGAFGMLALGGLLNTLNAMKLVPHNAISANGVQFGSALEMVLLAFALADRINVARREKEKAQREALQAQEDLVGSLKQAEQVLEERVKLRTAELEASNDKLTMAHKRQREITDNVPIGIYQIKGYPNGRLRIKFLSRRILDLFGIGSDSAFDRQQAMELLTDDAELSISPNQALFERVPDDDKQMIQRVMMAAVQQRTGWHLEYRVVGNSGDTRWMLNNSTAVTMPDDTVHFNGYIEDITERRNMQSQLIQSEKMASLGQLVANVAHEINTPIGAIKSSGKNITDALDHALEQLPSLFQLLPLEERLLFIRLIHHGKGATPVLNTREERTLVQKASQEIEAAGIENARYKASILVLLRAQNAIAEYLPLLRHAECNLILDTAQSLASIISNADNINIAVDRVTRIIFALKSFSRMDATGEMSTANLRDGIETVLTIYQNQIRQGTELVRQCEDIPPLLCLPDELNQVWTNLIHNALQAMNYQGTLTIGIRKIGNEAVVSVADTGCGIPEDIRAKIFDAFFTTKPAGEGSGLGLDIVKKIIDKHKGRIEVQSTVGAGTCFSVHLPYPSAS